MDPSARMLRLLSLLQARPNWTGPELSDRLGVTDRTLRRDINRLRELGYPVEAFSGPAGGYQLAPGGALPPLLLDDDEAIVVALGLRSAASGGLPGFEDSAIAALAKIEQVLPVRLRDRIADLHDSTVRLGRSPSGAADPLKAEVLVTIAQACRRTERIRFGYVDSEGNQTQRHAEPYQLVHSSRRWYLVARDRDRDAWRTFRVDRMTDLTMTGLRFSLEETPDAVGMVAEGVAVAVYDWHARVLLKLSPDRAAELISPTTGVLAPARGGTMLRIGTDDLEWLAFYLAGLPCEFKVIEPDELKDAVRTLAQGIIDRMA